MPDHYEPTIHPRAEHRAPDLLTIVGRRIARAMLWLARCNWRWWTGTGTRWKTVAFVASWLIAGWWLGGTELPSLVSAPYASGAEQVQAASEPFGTAEPLSDARYTSADVMATAAAVVALNAPSGAAQDDPMVAIVPEAAGPGGPVLPEAADVPDDGSPPAWLSRELSPYWGVIVAAAHERGIDSHWMGILAMVENPQAVTDIVTFDGGYGLAQIQRGTAAVIQAESGLPCVDGWMDPTTSYRCGAWYFRQAIDDGADLVRSGDNEPALLMGVAGYNSGRGSAIVKRMREALASVADDPCAWIGNEYTRRYCYSARDMWAQTLATRSATAPAAAEQGPFAPPRVAPGAPSHLEVSSVQP